MTAGTDFGSPPPASGNTFIGVPNTYAYLPALNRTGFGVFGAVGLSTLGDQSGVVSGAPVAPRYQIGDEFAIASMPPEQLARLQQEMATAGLIGSNTKVHVGIADDSTVAAFKSLLGFANVNGLGWQTALTKLAANPPIDTGVQLPNPGEEDQALYTAAKSLLGHDPNPTQLQEFRPYYEAKVKASTSTELPSLPDYNAVNPGELASPSSVAPPSLDTAAQQFLHETDAAAIAQQNVLTKYGQLLDFIKGDGTVSQ